MYSAFSDTVLNWAKKFTPRIPIGNTKLYLLWPGTIIGALVGVFKALVSKFKHTDNTTGKPCNEHQDTEHTAGEKRFSDVPLEADFDEYCKIIPGYKNLAYLNSLNFRLLDGVPEESKRLIWKYLPSFLVLATPKDIREYRKDYLSDENPRDYAEILFMFGNELVFIWDFDTEAWYIQDKTYKPQKEWRIGNSKKEELLQALAKFCDPERDELLKHRLEAMDPDHREMFTNYCKILGNCIKDVSKY